MSNENTDILYELWSFINMYEKQQSGAPDLSLVGDIRAMIYKPTVTHYVALTSTYP